MDLTFWSMEHWRSALPGAETPGSTQRQPPMYRGAPVAMNSPATKTSRNAHFLYMILLSFVAQA
jgi:hypothetical protein